MAACCFYFLLAVSVWPPPAGENFFSALLSPPPVFRSFASSVFRTMTMRIAFIRVSFFFISSLSFTDLPHFLHFPLCRLSPHPNFSPSIPYICSAAFFSSCFSSVFIILFIPLFFHLFEDFEVLRSSRKLFFFLQPFLALSFLLHSVFFLSSSTSAVFILIFPQLSFHILILDFFSLYCEFFWCLFSAIFSSFLSCCWRFTYKVISDFPSVSAAVVHCL